jgi:hypothetical protein
MLCFVACWTFTDFAVTAALIFEILFYVIYVDHYKLLTQKVLTLRVDS